MHNSNAWNRIPLEDYERHMQHENVAQAQVLNSLTNKYLKKNKPKSALFLGVSGGNGLEHIDVNETKTVYGIDINESYLREAKKRFGEKLKQLVLINADISTSTNVFLKADFVLAALIFEYIDIKKGFEFIVNNLAEGGKLIITIQSNNGSQTVSQTGIESIQSVKEIFKIVDKDNLQHTALAFKFKLIGMEETLLPNGKSLFTYEFERLPG